MTLRSWSFNLETKKEGKKISLQPSVIITVKLFHDYFITSASVKSQPSWLYNTIQPRILLGSLVFFFGVFLNWRFVAFIHKLDYYN